MSSDMAWRNWPGPGAPNPARKGAPGRPGAADAGTTAATAGRAPDLAPRRDVLRRSFPERLRMSSAQVNLVVLAIQTKAVSSFCLTAIDIIDEQGLYLLGHACSVFRGRPRDEYSLPTPLSLEDQAAWPDHLLGLPGLPPPSGFTLPHYNHT